MNARAGLRSEARDFLPRPKPDGAGCVRLDAGVRAVAAEDRSRSDLVPWKTGQAGLWRQSPRLLPFILPTLKAPVTEEGGSQRRDRQKAGSQSSPQAHFSCHIRPNSKAIFRKGRAAPKRR